MTQHILGDYYDCKFDPVSRLFLEHEIAHRYIMLDIVLSNGECGAPLLHNLLDLNHPMSDIGLLPEQLQKIYVSINQKQMYALYKILKLVGNLDEYGQIHHRLARTISDDNIVIRSHLNWNDEVYSHFPVSEAYLQYYYDTNFNYISSLFLEHEVAHRHIMLDIVLSKGEKKAPLLENLLNLTQPMCEMAVLLSS